MNLEKLKDKAGKFSARKITSMDEVLSSEIDNYLQTEVYQNLKTIEKIYWIINGYTDYPVHCKKCQKPVTNFRSITDGYISNFCSRSCQQLFKFDTIGRKEKIKLSEEQLIAVRERQKENRKKTCMERYGVASPLHKGEILNKRLQNKKVKYIENKIEQLGDTVIPLFDIAEYIGSKEKLNWQCNKCQTVFEDDLANGFDPICPTCYTPKASKAQHEIADFIKNLGLKVRLNDRSILKNKEIDILISEYNFGIEYNGLYWHSEKSGIFDKNHLKDKMILAKEKGIKLINIFEDEWLNKTDIIKSIISSKLGLNNKIYARKCVVLEISKKICDDFLDTNHIQGKDASSVRLGLFYENELVSVMTFVKPRFDKSVEWELGRFCSKLNFSVVGAASKLFKYFIRTKEPSTIISYADLRFGEGNVYKLLGFNKISENTGINYFYIGNKFNRLSRYTCQKHKLSRFLKDFNPLLSEEENMKNNGYYKVWDCGNAKWKWEK